MLQQARGSGVQFCSSVSGSVRTNLLCLFRGRMRVITCVLLG